MALKTRRPSCAVPYPLILVEGAEKSGKSWACAAFSASDKIGTTYWIDLGEGSADEYGAIPGANYEIVEHNGTFGQILGAVREVYALAQAAHEAKAKPVVLVIDSMTAEWELIKDVAAATMRRRIEYRSKKGGGKVPGMDEEIKIDMDLWNEANDRHRKLMTMLMTFPGIVLVTARGKETVLLDDQGKPLPKYKGTDYRVEGNKNLAYDVTAWVRFSRDHAPMVIGARTVFADMRPGVHEPKPDPELTIEKLIFEYMRCDPHAAHTRDLVTGDSNIDAPESSLALAMTAAVEAAENRAQLTTVWNRLGPAVEAGDMTTGEARVLQASIKVRGADMAEAPAEQPAPAPAESAVSEQLMKRLHVMLGNAGITERPAKLAFYEEVVGYPVTSTKDLSENEVRSLIFTLQDRAEHAGANA